MIDFSSSRSVDTVYIHLFYIFDSLFKYQRSRVRQLSDYSLSSLLIVKTKTRLYAWLESRTDFYNTKRENFFSVFLQNKMPDCLTCASSIDGDNQSFEIQSNNEIQNALCKHFWFDVSSSINAPSDISKNFKKFFPLGSPVSEEYHLLSMLEQD